MTVVRTVRIDEQQVAGKPLGRHGEHDERSRAFAFAPDATGTGGLRTVTHQVRVPVLDQRDVGACTGFAVEACAGTDPFFSAMPDALAIRPTTDADTDAMQALSLYATATRLDAFAGAYPPDDTGSTGLAAAKAATRAGLVSGYRHCFSLSSVLTALQLTPIITGVNWYEGMDTPDSDGLVHVTGQVRGGHEFCLYGLDVENQRVLARNSWGPAYGRSGDFALSWDDYARLLDEQGDATVMVPLTQPAPIPIPVQSPADRVLATQMRTWLTAKGL